ncbi:MAG: 3-deoxy-manno-octulosonate cytidylyltransferase [Syntrophaceae bacterium]|nr:3-deoxy-manno-octulosonate cytidylyltransferase [Syntrophaceae bacterium]
MIDTKKVAAVIPVRLESKKFPDKALVDIEGKPLIWHVWNCVGKAKCVEETIIATDSDKIRSAVEGWGGKAVMTSSGCRCGTERIAEILRDLRAEYILNIQADMPFMEPGLIDDLVKEWQPERWEAATPVYKINSAEELWDPNLVKVVRAKDEGALYFSRTTIPYMRDIPKDKWLENNAFWGHVGIYAYRHDALEIYKSHSESTLEKMEKLEQLRILEAGLHIQAIETQYHPLSVNSPEDMEKVRLVLQGENGNNIQ